MATDVVSAEVAGAVVPTQQNGMIGSAVEKVKVTLNLLRKEVEALQTSANERGISFTQAVREAIATDLFLRQAAKDGDKVLLEGQDGRYRQVVFR